MLCGDPIEGIECWLCCESMEPTLSILGGLAVVLNGVLVETGVWITLPLTGTLPGGIDTEGGVTLDTIGMTPAVGIDPLPKKK